MSGLSILVVDDEEPIRSYLATILTRKSYSVTVAADGRSAVDLMGEHQFDVILTDVLMPNGDGLEVMIAAKRWQSDAKIIAMSGGGLELGPGTCLQLAAALGSATRLFKPFTADQLDAAIEAATTARTA